MSLLEVKSLVQLVIECSSSGNVIQFNCKWLSEMVRRSINLIPTFSNFLYLCLSAKLVWVVNQSGSNVKCAV